MAQPYIGEIRLFTGVFAPAGWFLCQGQLLAIVQYEALFSLIGTLYGGDGEVTFGLPDLRGRVPAGMGQAPGLTSRNLGDRDGAETVGLTVNTMPFHSHAALCSTLGGNQTDPTGHLWAREVSGVTAEYQTLAPDTDMAAAALASAGSGTGHNNLQPYLPINYIIAYNGFYPS